MAKIETVNDLSPQALGELKAWLEPWFLNRDRGGCCIEWEDTGVGCGPATLSELILADSCLVAFWKLNESSGDTATDSGPNGYDLGSGALNPPTWGQPAGPPGELTATFGGGIGELSGAVPSLAGPLTLEIWASRDTTNHGVLIYQGEPIATHTAGVGLSIGAFNEGGFDRPKVFIGNTSTGPAAIEADAALAVDMWAHIAVTYNGTTWTLYVNGVAQTTTSTAAYTPATSGIYIGADAGLSRSFAGSLSYAAVYNCALDAATIAAHYAAATA